MSKDDFDVIVYKVLSYLYACIKAGVEPSLDKAHEVAGCNDVYWNAVFADMLEGKLIAATAIKAWGEPIYLDVRITSTGAAYLRDNSRMAAAGSFLGKAFEKVLESAIASTMAL